MKIVIAAGRGFIGSHLAHHFQQQGAQLVLLTREQGEPNTSYWNPEKNEIDLQALEGADAVINLAGENIFGRWSEKKKEKIKESRIVATQFLCTSLSALKVPPKVYLGASAVGYYGDRPKEKLIESSPPGSGFLEEVCAAWEAAAAPLAKKNIRVLLCRFGIILGPGGGALKMIQKAFGMGMGGVLGSGEQMMSWMAIDDVCSAMQHLIEKTDKEGPVNFTAPHAVTNLEFTKTLGKILNRPTLVTVPKFALNMFFGEGAEIFLASANVYPKVLLESGYIFQYPELESTLKKYLN